MMRDLVEPDDALLWARGFVVDQCIDGGAWAHGFRLLAMPAECLPDHEQSDAELAIVAHIFRAGQSASEARVAELEAENARLQASLDAAWAVISYAAAMPVEAEIFCRAASEGDVSEWEGCDEHPKAAALIRAALAGDQP